MPIGVVCGILAVLAAIAGALVLLAAFLDSGSGYTVNMFFLYAGWIVLLASCAESSREVAHQVQDPRTIARSAASTR